MTELLDEAISRVRELPPAEQDRVAATLLDLLSDGEPAYRLTDEQIEQVRRTREGLRSGTDRLATDEEVAAMWKRFGL